MKRRVFSSIGVLGVAVFLISLASVPAAGQAPTKAPAGKTYKAPRTPDGKPDLQGVWDYRTATPLERPNGVADKEVDNDEEAAELAKAAASRNQDRRDGAGTDADVGRAYNDFWWDFGKKVTTNRTSLIIDPPDGRVPPLTAAAQARGVRAGFGGGGGVAAPA